MNVRYLPSKIGLCNVLHHRAEKHSKVNGHKRNLFCTITSIIWVWNSKLFPSPLLGLFRSDSGSISNTIRTRSLKTVPILFYLPRRILYNSDTNARGGEYFAAFYFSVPDVIHPDRDLQGSQLSDRLLQLHDVDLLHARIRLLLRAQIQRATCREAFSGADCSMHVAFIFACLSMIFR